MSQHGTGPYSGPSGPVYTVPFSAAVLTTNEQELFHIHASTVNRVILREIRIGQYTEFGDAAAELLSITLLRGSTEGSGGSAITTPNVLGHSGAPTALSSCLGPSTTLSSSASADLLWADTFNVAAGWLYAPAPDERPTLEADGRLALRMSPRPTA